MTDKTCTHCGGSGEEPDPIANAWKVIETELGLLPMGSQAGVALSLAAVAYRDATAARITFLEAGLRDFLSCANEHGPGRATMFQVSHDRVQDWRAILDDRPGRLIADGTCPCGARSLRDCVRPTEPTCPGGC